MKVSLAKYIDYLMIALGLALVSCSDGSFMKDSEITKMTSENFHVLENHCTEKAPVDDAVVDFCKTLKDDTVHRVSLLPSTYVQDPETCVITVVEDGMKMALLEMEFLPCDLADEGVI